MKWVDISKKQPYFMETVLLAFLVDGRKKVSVGWVESEDDEDPVYYCPERRQSVDPTHWMKMPDHPLE